MAEGDCGWTAGFQGVWEKRGQRAPLEKKDELTGSCRLEARGLQRRRVSEKSKAASNERGRDRQTDRESERDSVLGTY